MRVETPIFVTLRRGHLAAILVAALVLGPATVSAQGGKAPPDLSGTWDWQEHVIIKLPAEVAVPVFGFAQPEGRVMHLTCWASGTMTLWQAGSTFTGIALQQSFCLSKGGQLAAQPPFPPSFEVTGFITGHAAHFHAVIGEGFECPYKGSLSVENGIATALNATGRCNVPIPVRPNVTKNVSFEATRQ